MKFTFDDLTDGGERVSPNFKDFLYYAHLSIYDFARPYAQGKRVLDAGCGTGYGAAYLKDAGAASVLGLDLSAKAVNFAQKRYAKTGLRYQAMSLEALELAPDTHFDLIFSSNALEHVAQVDLFLEAARALLRPDGLFIMAVPPISTLAQLQVNFENPYHVNNLTPQMWLAKLERFFEATQGYKHWMAERFTTPQGAIINEKRARTEDFCFIPQSAEELMSDPHSLTLVIVAERPRPASLPPTEIEQHLPAEWITYLRTYADAASQVEADEDNPAVLRAHLQRAQIVASVYKMRAEKAEQTMLDMKSSAGWRLLQRWRRFKMRWLL